MLYMPPGPKNLSSFPVLLFSRFQKTYGTSIKWLVKKNPLPRSEALTYRADEVKLGEIDIKVIKSSEIARTQWCSEVPNTVEA